MKKSAEMRSVGKAINKLRNRYIGRDVIYIPSGTAVEYPAVIRDMSYDPQAVASDGTAGDWHIFIEYLTPVGIMTGHRTCGELTPVGWK